MYPLDPPAVYVHESVMADPRYQKRVENVVRALQKPIEPVVYGDADLPVMIREKGLLERCKVMGALNDVRDPILLFNTFRFDDKGEERCQALKAAGCEIGGDMRTALLGEGAFHWSGYNLKDDPHRKDKVCRPCWRIHLQHGCVHRCKYCGLGGLLVSMVNIEDYCQNLGRIIERHPWQTTYLLDDDADPPALEPEQGVLGALIEYFGTLQARYLVVHTKTWNSAWVRELKHNGNTILVWSLAGATQSRLIEPKAGTTEERVEAARVAEQAGYPIRYKFKPIIPVKTWREDAAHAVKLLFEKTHPDIISLCVFMWMDVDEMKRRLPLDLLDPTFLKAAEEGRAEMEATHAKPFPHAVRTEIYDHYLREIRKYDKEIPVSLSTENFAIWKDFRRKLGMSATNYVCGCGPMCVPGMKKLDQHPFKAAVKDAAGIPGTV
jgi:DNA repair photolyase